MRTAVRFPARVTLEQILDGFARDDEFQQLVTRWERIPPRQAVYAPFPEWLDGRIAASLRRRGILSLYSHQAEALETAHAGKHTVVVTPTASGKTLCYDLPVLDAIAKDPSARLERLSRDIDLELKTFTYDGDTPPQARAAIRSAGHVVISNPDMLHTGILPHHTKWVKLFENLRYVVLDELHTYRGVFGSNVANVLRRLRRICAFYGSHPVFICTSATIANPEELARRHVEDDVVVIDRSGAPRGEKVLVFVNPPVVNRSLGIRKSSLLVGRDIAATLLASGVQTIAFTRSRVQTELLLTYLRGRFPEPQWPADLVRGYRGGYLPSERRAIERGLRDGSVRGVVSTNALELGIDIGALDVAVLAGYPGTIAATWQRAGRAGRRSTRSAAVLVASSAPIDQFIVRNPSYFFDASAEHALINPDNLHILLDHVKCAAFELPFKHDDRFGTIDVQAVLSVLGEEGFVHHADGQWNWTHESYPADAVSLRSVSSDNFVVVDTTHGERVIGETDFTSGPATLHEKAIYLVEGQLFHVERFDFDGRKAYVRMVDCDYYTDAITYTKVTILDTFASDGGWGMAAKRSHGEVHVVSRVVGFKKIKFYTNENVGSGELDLPEQQMHTSSYWLTIPAAVVAALPFGGDDRRDGVVGLAFAMRHIAQLLLMCDRHDIGLSVDGGSLERSARTGGMGGVPDSLAVEPKVFIYDNYPGGIGFSRPLFDMHALLLERTRDLIDGCPCDSGCPSCVGPEGNTGPNAKRVASQILAHLLAAKAV
ncbi:MAG: hypothetical protein DMF86_25490 [Acidobacteria bacterium]|nr:MAG: hypothetical protein DMF86_25490 [Acidobacteriota bacterium]